MVFHARHRITDLARAHKAFPALGATDGYQRLVANSPLEGLGTVYLAGTLFLRGVDPSRPVDSVAELDALVDLGHRLLDANKERIGHVTTGDARPGRENWVYGRAGRPCRRCGTLIKIKRGEQGRPGQERLRFWCPNCQRQVPVNP
jgi:endonuclease-8